MKYILIGWDSKYKFYTLPHASRFQLDLDELPRRGTGAVRTVLYGNPLLVQNPSQIAYRTVPYRLCCVFFYVNIQGFRKRPEQHMGMREIIRPQPISPSRFFGPSRKGMYILLSPFSLGYAAQFSVLASLSYFLPIGIVGLNHVFQHIETRISF